MNTRAERGFCWLSPLPLIALAGVMLYLSGLEGWGAWAAGSLVLVPLFLSLVLGLCGAFLVYRARARGEATGRLLLCTLLAASVVLWFGFSWMLMEVKRSFF